MNVTYVHVIGIFGPDNDDLLTSFTAHETFYHSTECNSNCETGTNGNDKCISPFNT